MWTIPLKLYVIASMAKNKFKAFIDSDCEVHFEDEASVMCFMHSLKGKEVEITISKWTHKRSHPQNNYYWGVVVKILRDHLGYNEEEMHDALRMKFLKQEEGLIDTVKSTTDLSSAEFEEYLTNVKKWAYEFFNLIIPEPNQSMEYYNSL